jgi:hypothetical protein
MRLFAKFQKVTEHPSLAPQYQPRIAYMQIVKLAVYLRGRLGKDLALAKLWPVMSPRFECAVDEYFYRSVHRLAAFVPGAIHLESMLLAKILR